MVKTRRQEQADLVAAAQEQDEEYNDNDTTHVYVPQQSSSRKTDNKRSRHDDHSEEEEMTPAKKRKSLPVRAKDEDEVQLGKTRPVVEIISKRVMSPVRNSVEDSESEGEEGEDEEVEDEEGEDNEDEDEEDENEEILSSHPANGEIEQGMKNLADPDQTVHKNKRKFGGERQVVPSSDPADNESELEGQEEPTPENLASKKHKRFGSEDVAADFLSTAPEAAFIEDEEEENSDDSDDSDDEAPEAVTTEAAAQTAKLKQREAANAIQEQLSASRKKRKEREATIKKQQDKKRRKEEKIARREAARAAKSEIEADIPMKTQESESAMLSIDSRGPLPNLLPLEYLEDDEDVSAPQPLLDEPARAVSKKTRFRDLVEKAPKDKRVGRTTYRVVKTSNNALAPKAAYNARKTKESWLAGMRRGSGGKLVGGGERKVMNKGFLKR